MGIKRKDFAKIAEIMPLPNMVEIQTKAFEDFLQMKVPPARRKIQGLQEVFLSTFPVSSPDGNYRLEYVDYSFGRPKYDLWECLNRSMTYAAPLRARFRLHTLRETREQVVYLGEMPLMTPTGTFMINGDERVVVSQLHRSPGVCFEEEVHATGKKLCFARIIPSRGAWIEFEFDINDILYVYIDRRKKFLATTFLRALGYSEDEDILKCFDGIEEIKLGRGVSAKQFAGRVLAADLFDEKKKEQIASRRGKITPALAGEISEAGIDVLKLWKEEPAEIVATMSKERSLSRNDALLEIYHRLRPGDPPVLENAQMLFNRLFFDTHRYDLGRVGRFVLNRKLGMDVPLDARTLTPESVVETIRYLLRLKRGEGAVDDIDHLGNRRVRTVDELLSEQFRIGLIRLARSAEERLAVYQLDTVMPHHLINSKLLSSVIRDFFGRSQLSQFMDQTNPLAELTHKRRLSALGPGGLSRERAGFEVRDVHHSHYGRICPIETPEGPNIGLIASLSIYARINEFGFIETPYRKVVKGRVTGQIEYMSADVEDQYVIAQASAPIDSKGNFLTERVSCRYKGDFPKEEPARIDYMDVSPRQLVSVAAALIPFLEHDDANRALMGSNMQRQAVPLLVPETPLVGTGMEERVARDSGAVVVATDSGTIKAAESDRIVIGDEVFSLRKFERSNASTCINQRPLVRPGQKVKAGDIIADGSSTNQGELALGRNVLVAFMPWRGYNFEDAILISEKLAREDVFTSIHIEEFEVEARDVRLGNEEITRDIPNVGEEALRNLDEQGIVRVGAEVGPGDILVGKISPKSETEPSPEEKLLRAIFGEKAQDVRDTSLTCPPGVEGIVVNVKVFVRKGQRPKSKEELRLEQERINEVKNQYQLRIRKLKKDKQGMLSRLLLGKEVAASIIGDETGEVLVPAGKTINQTNLKSIIDVWLGGITLLPEDERVQEEVRKASRIIDSQIKDLLEEQKNEIDKIKEGDELPPGVSKRVVVSVASKKKIQVGDKIAGRHGNKGVIAKILPEEDMPFLPDGTPVQVVLNPLGVPSRMNVGQILETHLGWAAWTLGFFVASPVFGGASEAEVKESLKKAGLPDDGKTILFDGLTGEPFDQRVTVGYIYMMKLNHLVDDKIHARCIGPYSLVTQQPLGGKAQFGGQRFGEMEVWALEAYGAAYTLQELLTVKSDDVLGRTRIYEAIVKGENTLRPGTPESFNVLVKELQSLSLDVKTEKKNPVKA